MPDWRQLVRARLAPYEIPTDRQDEAVAELALLAEDAYRDALSRGIAEGEALRLALAQGTAWEELAREICAVRQATRKGSPRLGEPGQSADSGGGKANPLGGLMHDIRFGLRMLAKQPLFTGAAVLILALGIGIDTSVFSVVNAMLFKPLAVADPHTLVRLYSSVPDDEMLDSQPLALPDVEDLRRRCRSLEGLTAYTLTPLALERGEESELVLGEAVTGNYFATLGVRPALGRALEEDDDRKASPRAVAVLTHSTWRRRFGADPNVVGREMRLNGHPVTIVGVGPASFNGMARGIVAELWIPLSLTRTLRAAATMDFSTDDAPELDRLDDRHSRWLWAAARRRPEVSLAQVNAELQVLGQQLEREYPETNEHRSFEALAEADVRILPDFDGALYASSFVLMGLVGLVLLIASANVANMLLAQAASRRREIAVRLSIGASRSRLLRQLLTESLLLAILAGALGLLIAVWSNRWLNGIQLPVPVQLGLGLSLDWRVLLFAISVSTATAVLFGLGPALKVTRQELSDVLKEDSGVAGASGRGSAAHTLVVAQVALSALLLVSAGLSLRSLLNAHRIDPGFETAGVVAASIHPDLQGYPEAQSRELFLRLLEQVRALPGVRSAAVTSHVLLHFELHGERVAPDAQAASSRTEWPDVDTACAGPGYFETLGIPILRGRGFTEHDSPEAPKVAVVNEELAARFWPGEDAVGQRLHIGNEDPHRVVGVVRNSKYRTLVEQPRPFVYRPPWQGNDGAQVVLARVDGSPRLALGAIRAAVRELDPRIPVSGLQTLEEAIGTSLLLPQASAIAFATFGLLGLVLAGVGIYSVIAYAVSQRTREIGLRVAMGARRGDILTLVMRRGMGLTALGLVLGLAGAAGATRVLSAVLYGISATDALTFTAVPFFILLVALAASYFPARRAARLDPASALRRQ